MTAESLRKVSDDLLRDLERLASAEDEKRQTPTDDPRFVALAAEVEAIATRVLERSSRQRDIATTVHADAGSVDAATTIEDTPRPTGLILAEWRAAERTVEQAAPGSAEVAEARAQADRLREEYRRAYEAIRER